MMRKILLLSVLTFLVIPLFGQYFSTGEDPANIRWRQISTVNFQLIYPDSFEVQAQKLANYFEKVYQYGSGTLNHKPRKISVIFHTRTVKSNGLVAWAPRRMEIFTPPHQEIYAQDWLEQLAIHEFRHVVQIDKVHTSLPGLLKIIFGEQIGALVTGAYLPFWFLEGDAVISETALSHHGRGRLPSFLMEHRAQVVEKGVFSFDKAFNRSYRDFVPDHYKLGYHLVGESRARYGADLWENAIDRIARKPWSVTPLNRSLKIQTGLNQEGLYNSVFDSLRLAWMKEDAALIPVLQDTISLPVNVYTNYIHNHILPDGNSIALKSGFEDIPHFVMLDENGHERKILTPGQILDESVGYRNYLIVWSEFVPDVRWTHSGRSLIRIYNLKTLEQSSFFPDYKCFAPALSPDEQYVAAVEVNFENDYYLSVYNATSGDLVVRYQTPGNNYLFSPEWISDSRLALVVLTREGKRLALINPFDGNLEYLPVPPGHEVRQLKFHNGKIYLINGHSGRDELWCYDLMDQSYGRLTTARFGHAFPAIHPAGNRILLSDYTSDGYQLVSIDPGKTELNVSDQVDVAKYTLAEILALQEPGVIDFESADTLRYNSSKYSKVGNLFKFHSWAPFNLDVDSYDLTPGISFVSQNILGTAETTLGYKWNSTEETGRYFVNYEYKGLYPIVKLSAGTGRREADFLEIQVYRDQQGQVVRQDTVKKRFNWTERDLSLGGRVPFNLTRGAYFRLLQPEISYKITGYSHDSSTPSGFIRGNIQTLLYRLYYNQIRRQAYRDVMPNAGIVADAGFRHSPSGKNSPGTLVSGQLRFYLPGMLRNHGTSLYTGMQFRERGDKYSFSDVVRMPRGWYSMNNNQLGIIALDYSMPLFYPDRNIGSIVYFRRVRSTFWGDMANLRGDIYKDGKVEGTFSRNLASMGIDVTSDINLLRLYAPANAGVRTIFLPETGKFRFEFLFSIDFTSF
jgi:hypothetical protein